jgi:hypothetical protein
LVRPNQRTALVRNCFVEVSLSGSYHAKGDLRFRDSHRPPLLPGEGRACPNNFLGQVASTLRLPDLPIATHCIEVKSGWINHKEWRAQVDATRGCSPPIHLRGASAILDRDGAVLLERAGTVLASCENRRESVCPACTAAGRGGRTLMGCVASRGGGQQDEPALVHTRAEPETYFGAGCAQQMHEAMEALRHAESGRGINSRERTIREWAQPSGAGWTRVWS